MLPKNTDPGLPKSKLIALMIIYLAGVFMGALDTGIVTPARTVIQNNLLVNEQTGIWMITIYTLAYAASIPIMGKLADMYGRKVIYLTCIFLFGFGSLFCGLAQDFQSFTVLLAARVVQAVGGGGIIPVANAELGTTFPPEKRGIALGLIGGVYGVANIFGASVGSAILDLFGKNNWQLIFYINLPVTALILIFGLLILPNTRNPQVKKIDLAGIFILTVMILSLMYGLKNLDFFDLTLFRPDVYPFFIFFIVLVPLFILTEKKARDPVLNLSYFIDKRIAVTFIISLITGVIMMGAVFVPQFCENALKIASGSGGYFVIALGLFSGLGAPLSGKAIDRFGPKTTLAFGFLITITGCLSLVFMAVNNPGLLTVLSSLAVMGLGIGFTMGTPLNYMMLENTKKEEAGSAMAAVSLIRSLGMTLAPAIMVGFLAQAGISAQANITDLLPKEAVMPKLPYTQEIPAQIGALRTDPQMKNLLATVYIPDLSFLEKIQIKTGDPNTADISQELRERLKTADVTTITETCKEIAAEMFAKTTPPLITRIQNGIQSGIEELKASLPYLQQKDKAWEREQITQIIGMMQELYSAVPGAFETAESNYLLQIENNRLLIEEEFQAALNRGFRQVYAVIIAVSLMALLFLAFYRKGSANDSSLNED